jgi:hypothetical protein
MDAHLPGAVVPRQHGANFGVPDIHCCSGFFRGRPHGATLLGRRPLLLQHLGHEHRGASEHISGPKLQHRIPTCGDLFAVDGDLAFHGQVM